MVGQRIQHPTQGMDVCVLSGTGLCDELIPRAEEIQRPWCVVACDLETSRMARPTGGCCTKKKGSNKHRTGPSCATKRGLFWPAQTLSFPQRRFFQGRLNATHTNPCFISALTRCLTTHYKFQSFSLGTFTSTDTTHYSTVILASLVPTRFASVNLIPCTEFI